LAKKESTFEIQTIKTGFSEKSWIDVKNMKTIHATIVLYHNDETLLKKAIESFLATELDVKLYLVDNSETDALKCLADIDEGIEYIFNDENLGFGVGHNIALRKSIADGVKYHLVLNPDVYFERGVVEELVEYMDVNEDVANVMPQILYPTGEIQYNCRILPTPMELLIRRFVPFKKFVEKKNRKYELRDSGYNKEMNVPFLHGSFMFLRVSALEELGLFDENIFMYMEDLDLNRRLHSKYRTMFYPKVYIYHVFAKESSSNNRLLVEHLKSSFYYFNKWGWFFDQERKKINKNCIQAINNFKRVK
jgi:GT2 family glycosyltransferase